MAHDGAVCSHDSCARLRFAFCTNTHDRGEQGNAPADLHVHVSLCEQVCKRGSPPSGDDVSAAPPVSASAAGVWASVWCSGTLAATALLHAKASWDAFMLSEPSCGDGALASVCITELGGGACLPSLTMAAAAAMDERDGTAARCVQVCCVASDAVSDATAGARWHAMQAGLRSITCTCAAVDGCGCDASTGSATAESLDAAGDEAISTVHAASAGRPPHLVLRVCDWRVLSTVDALARRAMHAVRARQAAVSMRCGANVYVCVCADVLYMRSNVHPLLTALARVCTGVGRGCAGSVPFVVVVDPGRPGIEDLDAATFKCDDLGDEDGDGGMVCLAHVTARSVAVHTHTRACSDGRAQSAPLRMRATCLRVLGHRTHWRKVMLASLARRREVGAAGWRPPPDLDTLLGGPDASHAVISELCIDWDVVPPELRATCGVLRSVFDAFVDAFGRAALAAADVTGKPTRFDYTMNSA